MTYLCEMAAFLHQDWPWSRQGNRSAKEGATKERATNCFRCTFSSWQGSASSRLPFSTFSRFPTADAGYFIDNITLLPIQNKNAFCASCLENWPRCESAPMVEPLISARQPCREPHHVSGPPVARLARGLTTIHSSTACQGDQKSFPRKVGISTWL